MENDNLFMQRCIQIAQNGSAASKPNPSVGAVLVYNNKIIAEGFTSSFGGNHAEVNAINNLQDKSLLIKSTLYVSLEPCSHFGKTPPCCDLIIKHKIPRVVIGVLDPNPSVAGSGIARIAKSGAEVVVGVLEAQCIKSNKQFFKFYTNKRPFITLKWAQSADGFIAPESKNEQRPLWISNEFSQQLSHKLRSETHAILVGTKTVLEDNPSLTTRTCAGKNPIRVVIDKQSRLSKSLHLFDNQAETISIGKHDINFDANVAAEIIKFLYSQNIQSVIIEGGRQTLQTFIYANLWDEAQVFTSSMQLHKGIKAPLFNGNACQSKNILTDKLDFFSNVCTS